MRKLFKIVGASILIGFFLGSGVYLSNLLFKTEVPDEPEIKTEYVSYPKDIQVINHHQTDNKHNFTVQGILKNTGNHNWWSIELELQIYAGKARMMTYSSTKRLLRSKDEIEFFITGRRTQGNVPKNVTYKIIVKRAEKEVNI